MINKIVNKYSRINCSRIKEVNKKLNTILNSDKTMQEKRRCCRVNFKQHLEAGTVKKIKEVFSDEHI